MKPSKHTTQSPYTCAFEDEPWGQRERITSRSGAKNSFKYVLTKAYSIISVDGSSIEEGISSCEWQPYVANNGHLFVFVVTDVEHGNCKSLRKEVGVQGSADLFRIRINRW